MVDVVGTLVVLVVGALASLVEFDEDIPNLNVCIDFLIEPNKADPPFNSLLVEDGVLAVLAALLFVGVFGSSVAGCFLLILVFKANRGMCVFIIVAD